jgi:hypothetical protein
VLRVKVGYPDDFLPTTLAEPTSALKPLCGEIAYLPFDVGVVCAVGSIGEKSRRLLVVSSGETVARFGYEAVDIGILDHDPSFVLNARKSSQPGPQSGTRV